MVYRSFTGSRYRDFRILFFTACVVFVNAVGLRIHSDAAAQATSDPVPRIEDAEQAFEQAVQAFEDEDYGMAFRRFRLVYANYPTNRKTTAAMLMAAKALYRQGEYNQAIDLLTDLVEQYPTSSYLDEAENLRELMQARISLDEKESQVLTVGVALPLESEPSLTQALFDGIHVAVAENNAEAGDGTIIRMVFRDSKGSAQGTRTAIDELVEAGANVIIGPMFSDEARAAATVAEERGIVLIAPLATDESVAENRQFVFQANPTITMRGRQMARFAIQELGLNSFGIVAELQDQDSERMAEGFQDEALQLGADVLFYKLMPGSREWYMLPEELDPELMSQVDALYLPISGNNAQSLIRAALIGLEQMNADVVVLGNKNWHNINTADLASRFATRYTNDFYAVPQNVRSFENRFREITNRDFASEDQRLVLTGYDVARFVLSHLGESRDEPLHEVLRTAPVYNGLGLKIDFAGGNVNEALYMFRYRSGRPERQQ